ncbi:MAG: tyrosine-type recombinase/integrase [Candidatus Dadabacteria bacterium]|nr:tyrosine-type recombinase/integrase [Candidatus Dadabacteria bacterium]
MKPKKKFLSKEEYDGQEIQLLDLLAVVPEEDVWLAGRHSRQTRRAYRSDVMGFMDLFGVRSGKDFKKVDHRAVVMWKRYMEEQRLKSSTVRRKLSALSSLFSHLVKYGLIKDNPVREVERPPDSSREGMTACFSTEEARSILDAPPLDTVKGLRDRAVLSVGFQVGARRSEIASLAVRDFHRNRGYWSLRFMRKGGRELSVSVHPQTARRIDDYLAASGHGEDLDGALFRPCGRSWKNTEMRRFLHPDTIDRILKKYAAMVGLVRGFSAHSMRATFVTRALENGASLEDVQQAVGHAYPSTTKLYDKRRFDPERSASFFANY